MLNIGRSSCHLKWYLQSMSQKQCLARKFPLGMVNPMQHPLQRLKTDDSSNDKNGKRANNVAKEMLSSEELKQPQQMMPAVFNKKYKIFRDAESTEIFDVEEERAIRLQEQMQDAMDLKDCHSTQVNDETDTMEFDGINMQRGVHGIFDIGDLVDVLRQEMAEDIFVCSVPKEMAYVDYMVICSGQSYRHMSAMAEFVRYLCKHKRHENDKLPKIEGARSRDWIAMDMGNIALHIFSAKAREVYDLESLWSIGIEYDREFNQPKDPLIELFEKHSFGMDGLQKSGTSLTDTLPNIKCDDDDSYETMQHTPNTKVHSKTTSS